MLNINIRTLTTHLILYLLKCATGLSSNDGIIVLSGFTSNTVSVSKITDAIIDVNGSTKYLDSELVPKEISIHHNDFNIKEHIDSVCMDIVA